jgi:hypothetical protein
MEIINSIDVAGLSRGQLALIMHPHPTLHGRLLTLAAELAAQQGEHSSLLVLDGGNCFNVYPVAQSLRRYTADVARSLKRIQVARAFTCFEMACLIQRTNWTVHAVQPNAILVLDMLSTFRDENVPLNERQRLLQSCLPDLRRLAQRTPILVSTRPADQVLTQNLLDAADPIWELELPTQPAAQLSLWTG